MVCKFCTEVILAKKNSGGYPCSFVAYKCKFKIEVQFSGRGKDKI